jgi:hypothetical protein
MTSTLAQAHGRLAIWRMFMVQTLHDFQFVATHAKVDQTRSKTSMNHLSWNDCGAKTSAWQRLFYVHEQTLMNHLL